MQQGMQTRGLYAVRVTDAGVCVCVSGVRVCKHFGSCDTVDFSPDLLRAGHSPVAVCEVTVTTIVMVSPPPPPSPYRL